MHILNHFVRFTYITQRRGATMNISTLPIHLIGTDFTDDDWDICDHGTNTSKEWCYDCERDAEVEWD